MPPPRCAGAAITAIATSAIVAITIFFIWAPRAWASMLAHENRRLAASIAGARGTHVRELNPPRFAALHAFDPGKQAVPVAFVADSLRKIVPGVLEHDPRGRDVDRAEACDRLIRRVRF